MSEICKILFILQVYTKLRFRSKSNRSAVPQEGSAEDYPTLSPSECRYISEFFCCLPNNMSEVLQDCFDFHP